MRKWRRWASIWALEISALENNPLHCNHVPLWQGVSAERVKRLLTVMTHKSWVSSLLPNQCFLLCVCFLVKHASASITEFYWKLRLRNLLGMPSAGEEILCQRVVVIFTLRDNQRHTERLTNCLHQLTWGLLCAVLSFLALQNCLSPSTGEA